MNNNNKVAILMVLTVIITIIGVTFAYWNWQSTNAQKTNVTFTVASGFTCGADGGGDITSNEKTLAPAACTNTSYAIQRTVRVSTTQDAGKTIVLDMWLKVNSIGSGLANSHNFKYALTTIQLSTSSQCSDESMATAKTNGTVVEYGTFYGANTTTNSEFKLIDGKEYVQSTNPSETYYLYIWLDSAEENSNTMNQDFHFTVEGSCTDEISAGEEWVYTVNINNMNNPNVGEVLIGYEMPEYIAANYQFGTPAEAMASWQTVPNVMTKKPYYLKHKVENITYWCLANDEFGTNSCDAFTPVRYFSVNSCNDAIETEDEYCASVTGSFVTESYVEFVIDNALKTQLKADKCNNDATCEKKIDDLNNGTFTLKGKTIYDGIDSDVISPYHLDNAKEIYSAFGTNCSENPNDVNFDSIYFECSVPGLSAHAYGSGIGGVGARDDTKSHCTVDDANADSYCHLD